MQSGMLAESDGLPWQLFWPLLCRMHMRSGTVVLTSVEPLEMQVVAATRGSISLAAWEITVLEARRHRPALWPTRDLTNREQRETAAVLVMRGSINPGLQATGVFPGTGA